MTTKLWQIWTNGVANLINPNQPPNIRTTSILLFNKNRKTGQTFKSVSHNVALPDPDPLVRGKDPDQAPDPYIKQK
jgi:hypothetical protein